MQTRINPLNPCIKLNFIAPINDFSTAVCITEQYQYERLAKSFENI